MSTLLPDDLAAHLDAILLGVFGIHLAVFAALSWKRRTWRYASTLGVFLSLMGAQTSRILAFNPELWGLALESALRGVAYLCLAITLINLVRRRRSATG